MQFALIDDVVLHTSWTVRGPNHPTIVFINSLGTDFRIWDDVVENLGGGFNILRHDKRWHGLSDSSPQPVRMDDFISDLIRLLDNLDVKQAILCGLSIGGIISIGLASRRPDLVRGLILCNTAPKVGTAEGWADRIAAVSRGGIAGIADMVLARWFTPEFRSDDNPRYRLARNMLLRQDARGYIETCAAIGATDFREEAKALRLPCLCIAGDHDLATPPAIVAEMAGFIAGSRYQLIEGCGHIPCIEKPVELTQHILTFVRDLERASA